MAGPLPALLLLSTTWYMYVSHYPEPCTTSVVLVLARAEQLSEVRSVWNVDMCNQCCYNSVLLHAVPEMDLLLVAS